ncbi:YwdI family protein [Mesobacillus subterraneus]|uniref:YwdI family protein n=1 Tax=Mesobacillus subterraneus TaxID=285983 RepID=UPI001CFEC29E|nr:YwdI family protein [Mesobacillus subterraneus]WLR55249.1 YwdI family protein [Mesobacillus subterraneus]
MNISLQKLLLKMEEELKWAKSADSEAVKRERIHSIKTLCELVLDESSDGGSTAPVKQAAQPFVPSQQLNPQQQMQVSQSSPMVPQPKKLEMEDDSNGDSLFDF